MPPSTSPRYRNGISGSRIPVTAVTASGTANTSYDFTAAISPLTTTTPVTYTWEITDQGTITNTDGLTNTVTLEWSSAGEKVVTRGSAPARICSVS